MASSSGPPSSDDTASPGSSTAAKQTTKLKAALKTLKRDPYSISLLKLLSCNGGCRRGVSFTSASVEVDYVYNETIPCLDAFTEIFATGNKVLMDFLEEGQKPVKKNQCKVLESLLTFLANIEKAELGLKCERNKDDKRFTESEWIARITIHYLASLSVSKDYLLDASRKWKKKTCPCPCSSPLKYGETVIGHPRTWYGSADVILGDFGNNNEERKEANEIQIVVTEASEEASEETVASNRSPDGISQEEIKVSPLSAHLSQVISQTIVFSFYQKNRHPEVTLVPTIAVSRTHIQFHFYDSEKDIYLMSREMPLFVLDSTRLNYCTVLATWLVVNYRYLITGVTDEMERETKYGFHTAVCPSALRYYQKEIEMGPVEPVKFKDSIITGGPYRNRDSVTAEIDAKYAKLS